MTIPTNEQIPRSWVHDPERPASPRAGTLRGFLGRPEVPGILGGIALTVLGRRVHGETGRGLSALGTTIALAAAGRAVWRIGPRKVRGWIAEKLPAVPQSR